MSSSTTSTTPANRRAEIAPPHMAGKLERRSTTGGYRFSFNGLLQRRQSGDVVAGPSSARHDATETVKRPSLSPLPTSLTDSQPHPRRSASEIRSTPHPHRNVSPIRSHTLFSLPSIPFPSAGLFRASAAVGHAHVPMGETEDGYTQEKERERQPGPGDVIGATAGLGRMRTRAKDERRELGPGGVPRRRESSFLAIRQSSGDAPRTTPEQDGRKSFQLPSFPSSSSSAALKPRRSLSAGRGFLKHRSAGIAVDPPTVMELQGGPEAEREQVAIERTVERLAAADLSENVMGGEGARSVSPVELASPVDAEVKGQAPIGFDFSTPSTSSRASIVEAQVEARRDVAAEGPLSGSQLSDSPAPSPRLGTFQPQNAGFEETVKVKPVAPVRSTSTVSCGAHSTASDASTAVASFTPPSKLSSTEALLHSTGPFKSSSPPPSSPSSPTSSTSAVSLWKQIKDAAPLTELSVKRAATMKELDDLFTGKQVDIHEAVRRIFVEDAVIEDPVAYCKTPEELALHLISVIRAVTSVRIVERKAMRIPKAKEDGDESGQCRWDQRVEYDIKGACVKKVIHSLVVIDFAPDGRIQHLRDCWNFQSLPVSHGMFSSRRSSAKLGLLGLITRRRRVLWHWESK